MVLEPSSLHLFFFVHVLDKIWVQEVGTQTNEPLQYWPCRDRKKPMGDEKKYDGARDPIKMFLEKSLVRKRNEMMDNFLQILQ